MGKDKKEERDPTVKVVMTKKAVNAEDPEDKEVTASKVATKKERDPRDPREKVKLTNPKLKNSSRCLKKALIWKKAKKEERDPTVKVVMTKKAVNAEDPEDKE